ncbi:vWA domain-containing protein [Rubrimonas cliftonensis]|uniref:MxaC protein n=1 Tax=Rubrimonas cliftonensis TaxID=89524 RepID=A0A1H4FJE8_9RHOB|nr:vWA domain-containing protein [Rubrimonas cliftonensis]SEA96622.1 mxaC protein [Rubrimonas cliftonensis]
MIGFDHPAALALAALAALPFLRPLLRRPPFPALALLPRDPASRALSWALRGAGALAFALLALGLAGPHLPGGHVERVGVGASLVLLIDRSSSMDNSFAGRAPGGGEESKSAAARRILLDFIDRRGDDRIGVAEFSTAPLMALPMTDSRNAVRAAVAAIDEPGLSQTDVGRGLAMALGMLDAASETGSRAVLLVSDGAAVIAPEVQETLRAEAARRATNIYWLYLRTEGAKGIFEPPAPGEIDSPQLRPERHLHLFLQRLGAPYRAFEAEDAAAVERAVAEIDRLEARPILTRAATPRRDLAPWCWGVAALCAALLALARLAERPFAECAPAAPVRAPGATLGGAR